MKRVLLILSALLIATVSFAQSSPGDKILGIYAVDSGDDRSKARVTKNSDNSYRFQIFWMEKMTDSKGNIRRDVKNPDINKRNTRADQMVIIDRVTYKDGVWGDGQIYDPTRGKYFRVEIRFKDENTLAVKGMWGIFSQTVYWPKLKE